MPSLINGSTENLVSESSPIPPRHSLPAELTPKRKQVYNNVLNEMASSRKLSSDNKETKRLLKRSMSKSSENIDINTIVPRDISEQRVVLLSSRSHNSDWELNKIDDQHDLNGVESEDSGFQLDIAEPSATTAPVTTVTTVTTTNKNDRSNSLKQDSHQKEGEKGIESPCYRTEPTVLQQRHSTPLPSSIAHVKDLLPEIDIPNRRSSVKEIREQIQPVMDPALNRDFRKGPDQIYPADCFTVTSATAAVKLKIDERGISSIPALSVPTLLQRTVSRQMDHLALSIKRDGKWVNWTYKQYLHDVRICAKAFIRLGLERFHSVCILGFNSPEWAIADLAAIHAGGFAAGIYTTNSAESCLHCALNSQANIIVVEDRKQLEKILEIKDKIPSLKAIIQYSGKPHVEGVITWSQLMNLGNATPDNAYEERLRRIAVNQCCTIIYTSGTTGPPKGVMLNHDNLTWISHVMATHMSLRDGKESFLSYLPLSHIAAQITDIYIPLSTGGTVYFAQPDALKGSLVDTLREVRPTTFFGVPRVWEKIYEKMKEVGKSTRGLKLTIANWSKSIGLKYNRRRMEGRNSKPFGYSLANTLVFKKVRKGLGLDHARLVLSGAAPLSNEVMEYFMSLDIPILEAYGMSESTGPHCVNNIVKGFQANSVGKTTPGAVTKINNPNANGEGEILMGGRHIFMGYLNDPARTSETINKEGFLCTGDIGHVDKYGFVYITGRIKEILITAGGENVAPVIIEDNIKSECPIVSQAMVVGDRRKFLSVVLTLKTNVDGNTQEPLPILSRVTRDWCREVANLPMADTVTDIINAVARGISCKDRNPEPNSYEYQCVRLVKAIDSAIARANQKAISGAQRVQKWSILPTDFSISGGELGPTMKMKRSVIAEKYSDTIERFYC